MNGSRTDITVVQLTCNGACQSTGFIDNEMWLADSYEPNISGGTPACDSNKLGACWVEAGYINDGGRSTGFGYFWADVRPVDKGNLNFHAVAGVLGSDINNPVRVAIYRQGTNQFEVDFSWPNCSYCGTESFYSTNNTMSPDDINIGMELAGTGSNSDWGAPTADYINNYWRCGSSWCAQTQGNGPGITEDNPPYFTGIYGSPGGTGGDFWSNCC